MSAWTVEIEQAIARGLTVNEIAAHVGCPIGEVIAVRAHMEALSVEVDAEVHRVPRAVLMAAAAGGRAPLSPCGTHAAHGRHRKRGEQPCDACVVGERAYQAARHQRRIAEQRERAA